MLTSRKGEERKEKSMKARREMRILIDILDSDLLNASTCLLKHSLII